MNKITIKVLALTESIAHHKRMREWVKKQDRKRSVSRYMMLTEILETTDGVFCACCGEYYCTIQGSRCKGCPVKIRETRCDDWGHPWKKMVKASTWKEWLKHQKDLLNHMEKQLKELND